MARYCDGDEPAHSVNVGTRAVEDPLGEKMFWATNGTLVEALREAQRVGIRPSLNGGFNLPPRDPSLAKDDRLAPGSRYTTYGFLELCIDAGLECTQTMNPQTFNMAWHFRNLGKKLVCLFISGKEFMLEPGERVAIDIPLTVKFEELGVTAFNYEVGE